jgi:MFS transporter, DHA3 family, macrolide efflux protein
VTDLEKRLADLSPEKLELLRARLKQQAKEEPQTAAPPPPEPMPAIEPRPADRFQPFPLTEVQEAYWIGRSGLYDLDRGANSYMEYDVTGADEGFVDRLEWAVQEFIERHDVLRSVVLPGGLQQVLPQVPPFRIGRVSLLGREPAAVEAALRAARDRMCDEKGQIDRWPLFEVLVHYLDSQRVRVHLRFDALLKEGQSRGILLQELPRLFSDPDTELTPLTCTYRDYAVSREEFEQSELVHRSEAYWMERLPALPPAPELPLAVDLGPKTPARFVGRSVDLLSMEDWRRLKARTARAGLTPTSVVLAAFADTIGAWSDTPHFTLGLIGTDRPAVHPQIDEIFGNFNTLFLFAVDDRSGTFKERARRHQDRLATDLEHRHFSGFRVLRELNRRAGGSPRAAVPVFFNSVVEHGSGGGPSEAAEIPEPPPGQPRMTEVEGSVHLPQILILPTFLEDAERGLVCKWQAVEDAFPAGLLDDLLAALQHLLERLAGGDAAWEETAPDLLPPAQRAARVATPQTDHVLDGQLMPRPDWVVGDLWRGETRTGLLARFLPGGEVEVLGRPEEFRVEKSGRRVEPGRVEKELERHPAVRAAAVLPRADGDGRTRLHAFVTASDGQETGALAAWLEDRLPPHLLPDVIETVSAIDPSDRSALAARLRPTPPPPAEPVAPRNETESELLAIWREILGRGPGGVTDDFFALGGNSLLVVRLMEQIGQRFGPVRSLPLFFERPTIEHLAGLVRRPQAATASVSIPAPAPAAVPPASLPAGMRTFLLIWFGQLVSALGTGLGSFSLGVWIYQTTHSTALFATMAFVAAVTGLLMAPVAGSLADRWDRRRILVFSDLGSAAMTLTVGLLLTAGYLRPWHVYPMIAAMVTFGTFQGPALLASITMLVPRRELARASGMAQASTAVTQIVGPLLAGVLVGRIGYGGVILIDFSTFVFAALTLLAVRIPRPPVSPGRRPILQDALLGLRYIRERTGLFSLLKLFALTNFSLGIVQVLLTPLILSFGTPADLGAVSAAGAAGGLLGALALSIWGGPKHKLWTIFGLLIAQGLLLFLGGKEPSVALITAATFAFMLTGPVIAACSQVIWQSKVALDVQGRVFAMRGMIASATLPLAYLASGLLADRVFEPAMAPGGALASTAGRLLGVGKGRGVGLLFVTLGLAIILITLIAFLNPRLRKVESELPDAM